jgi:hypothetical protein
LATSAPPSSLIRVDPFNPFHPCSIAEANTESAYQRMLECST